MAFSKNSDTNQNNHPFKCMEKTQNLGKEKTAINNMYVVCKLLKANEIVFLFKRMVQAMEHN